MKQDIFPLDRIHEIRRSPEKFRLLERTPDLLVGTILTDKVKPAGAVKHIVFLDCETTGLDRKNSKLIQLGMLRVECDSGTGQLLRVIDSFEGFEDPGRPLSHEIIKLTGFTDADLKGRSFSDAAVSRFLRGKPLVAAHNASFDRAFFDRRFPKLRQLPWGCTSVDPDWRKSGYSSRALSNLVNQAGYFFTGHNAVTDCASTAWLMHLHPERTLELLKTAEEGDVVVWARGSPFSVKDSLKKDGYRWHASSRCWYKQINPSETDAELDVLQRLYRGARRAKVERKSATQRFKDR